MSDDDEAFLGRPPLTDEEVKAINEKVKKKWKEIEESRRRSRHRDVCPCCGARKRVWLP